MKFLAALLFAAVGVSAVGSATSPDTPGSTCQADFILEDCLTSTTKIASSCKPTDYDCLCHSYQAVLTCYNNCPNDIRAPSVQQQVDSYCRTASLLATTPTTAPKTKTSESSSSEETSAAAAASSSGDASPTTAVSSETSGSRTSATTASHSSSTNAAATMVGHVAGVVVAVAGAAVAMI
ncbi:hypothetical protein Trco_003045 [Trichoderma cornu-damae]|uniref:HFB protein n=1 Tax=Trichoderma cornu-damae TaxID=654480 RepID=A0A9P8TZP7_9HYPO|nr:hypothetical protein Trco_003045 [Trichoderma cornu-damae]